MLVLRGKGCVYLLTNPAFPGYVRFGYAKDINRRLAELDSLEGIPHSFSLYAYFETDEKLNDDLIMYAVDKFGGERAVDYVDGRKVERPYHKMDVSAAYVLLARLSGQLGSSMKVVRCGNKAPEKKEEAKPPVAKEPAAKPTPNWGAPSEAGSSLPKLSLSWFIAQGTLMIGESLRLSGNFKKETARIISADTLSYKGQSMTPEMFVWKAMGTSKVDAFGNLYPLWGQKSLRQIYEAKTGIRSNGENSPLPEKKAEPIKKAAPAKAVAKKKEEPAKKTVSGNNPPFPTFSWLVDHGIVSVGDKVFLIDDPMEGATVVSESTVRYKGKAMTPPAFARVATGNQTINTYKNLTMGSGSKSLWTLWEEEMEALGLKGKKAAKAAASAKATAKSSSGTPSKASSYNPPYPTFSWLLEHEALNIGDWIASVERPEEAAIIVDTNVVKYKNQEMPPEEFISLATGHKGPDAYTHLESLYQSKTLRALWEEKMGEMGLQVQ